MFALSESCAALMYAKWPAACAGAHLHLSFRRASSSGSFVSGTMPCVYLHKSDPYGRSDAPHGPDWLGTANAMVLGQAALNLATHAASDRVALWPQWRSADEEADSLTGGGASARQQNGWGLFISAGQFGVTPGCTHASVPEPGAQQLHVAEVTVCKQFQGTWDGLLGRGCVMLHVGIT